MMVSFNLRPYSSFLMMDVFFSLFRAFLNFIHQTILPYNIQLLTIEALDMMWYRPESTNIDWGGAEVNIGILRSISHHVQCLNNQQLFYYIISINKKVTTTAKSWLCTMSWISFFYMMTNWFHSVKRGMNSYFIYNYNCRQRRSRLNAA